MESKRRKWQAGGAAGVAMVLALVLGQMIVVGGVIAGTRDQDLTVQRLDSTRSFYAAEAGSNMSIRELMKGIDEDNDGGIGTISNDGNANSDPLMVTARVSVTSAVAGGQTTLTVKARAGSCRRQVSSVVQNGAAGGAGNATTMCVLARDSTNTPRWSTWSGSAWGANTAFPSSIGAVATFVMLRGCPARNEAILVTEDDQKDVNVCVYNGASWGSVTEICTDVDSTNNRAVDVTYESLSGDALIVYWNQSQGKFGYRTWNGTTLSGESLLTYSGASDSDYLTLYPRPSTDEIILLAHVQNGSKYLVAAVWSGSAWGGWTTLTTGLQTSSNECYSLAFEGLSHDALVIYGESSNQLRYRTWNGSSWSAQGSLPSIANNPEWLRLVADPSTDTILEASVDGGDDLEANVWNGSSWGSNVQLESDTGGHSSRRFDMAFERDTSNALIVYREKNKNQPEYRVWNGSVWGLEVDGPGINRRTRCVKLVQGNSTGQVFIAVSDDQDDLHLMQWSGSAMSSDNVIEASLADAQGGNETFCIVATPNASRPKVLSWAEVQPQ